MQAFKNFALILVLTISVFAQAESELSKYFDGWCGYKNKISDSSASTACWAETITHTPSYKQADFLVLFTKTGVIHYEISEFKFLKDDRSLAQAKMTDPATKKSMTVMMDWHYEPAPYPGESTESFPVSLKGVSTEGAPFYFLELQAFYNGIK